MINTNFKQLSGITQACIIKGYVIGIKREQNCQPFPICNDKKNLIIIFKHFTITTTNIFFMILSKPTKNYWLKSIMPFKTLKTKRERKTDKKKETDRHTY